MQVWQQLHYNGQQKYRYEKHDSHLHKYKAQEMAIN
jgi:hypothetical protein